MKNKEELITDKFVFFWNGIYSQWYVRNILIDGVEYSSCEQYMMAMKARTFNDSEAYLEIMATNTPRIQKEWGRKVQGFDKYKWNEVCREIVYKGNLAKFTQYEDLREQLMETGDRELVEASPYDRIWGIGMDVDHPDLENKAEWNGLNWLGEAITRVRETIKGN